LKALGLIDKIVAEPLGGAHRDVQTRWPRCSKRALADSLRQFQGMRTKEPAGKRAIPACWVIGKFKETTPDA